MRVIIGLLLIGVTLITGCQGKPDPEEYTERLTALKQEIQIARADDGTVDPQFLRQGIVLADEFLTDWPTDTPRLGMFTYEKVKFHTELEQYAEAITAIDSFLVRFPEDPLSPQLLHFKGFYIYENGLRHLELARKTYNQFLETYPTHPELTEAVLFSLEHLGQSEEEILQSILEKAAARDTASSNLQP